MHRFLATVGAGCLALLAACGSTPVAVSSTAPPVASAPTPAPPAAPTTTTRPGGVLFAPKSVGVDWLTLVGDGHGFAGVARSGNVQTYDENGRGISVIDKGALNRECGVAMVRRSDGKDLVLTLKITTNPAAGVNPETHSAVMTAWELKQTKLLFTAPLVDAIQGDSFGCSSGELAQDIAVTTDGNHLLSTFRAYHPLVVDLRTGATREQPGATGVAGNSVVTIPVDGSGDAVTSFVDPATGQVTGTSSEPVVRNGRNRSAPMGEGKILVSDSSGGLASVTLPGGATDWTAKTAHGATSTTYNYPDPENDLTHVFMYDGGYDDKTNGTVYAIDGSGATVWTQKISHVCGVANGKLAVTVNKQLAVLDGKSGSQLRYDPTISTCPRMLTGGFAVSEDAVRQLL